MSSNKCLTTDTLQLHINRLIFYIQQWHQKHIDGTVAEAHSSIRLQHTVGQTFSDLNKM